MSLEHPPTDPPPAEPARSWRDLDWRHPTRQQVFIGGLIVAPLLAVGLGLLAAPHLDSHRAMQPVSAETMRIQLAKTANTPVDMTPGAKLQVLSSSTPAAPVAVVRPVDAPLPAPITAAPPEPAVIPVDQRPARGAGFDCGAARSPAEMMVCYDPSLAAADRRMQRAWRRALDSGASHDELRRDQRAWLRDRDEAALDSPEAVRSLYVQRTRELEDAADGGEEDAPSEE
ncbi:MAG: hypothetical protein JWP35_4178 [Caulobacter sp.]|nr:hypothetical protein [Caulobacter sp.]